MRLAGQERLGYYPTPTNVIEAIATYLAPSAEKGRLLDPCCGKGEAAALLATMTHCTAWGAELSPVRAEEAARALDKALPVAWEVTSLTDESITLLLLNPPYDWERATGKDEKAQRLEFKFLRSTTPKLLRGTGVLLYIVPQHILGSLEVARYLAGHFTDLQAVRFPDGQYEVFKQVIVLARRAPAYKPPSDEAAQAIQRLAEVNLPPLSMVSQAHYPLAPAPRRGVNGWAIRFYRRDWSPDEMVRSANQIGVQRTRDWADLLGGDAEALNIRPAMPLKKGHVATPALRCAQRGASVLMSSGMMGTLRLADEDGQPMLVKGRVVKTPHKVSEEADEATGEKVIVWRDRFVTTVAALSGRGLKIIDDVPGLKNAGSSRLQRRRARPISTPNAPALRQSSYKLCARRPQRRGVRRWRCVSRAPRRLPTSARPAARRR